MHISLTNAIQHQLSNSSSSLGSTSSSLPSTSENAIPPPLLKADYPRVKFWTAAEYAKGSDDKNQHLTGSHQEKPRQGRPAASNSDNNSNRYMEDKQGIIVNATQAAEARNVSHSIFALLQLKDMAPKTWMKATVEATQYFRREMYAHFPELRLCEGHWKVTRLAVDLYPSWYRSHVKDLVKQEVEDTKPSSLRVHLKRNHSRSNAAQKKRTIRQATPDLDEAPSPSPLNSLLSPLASVSSPSTMPSPLASIPSPLTMSLPLALPKLSLLFSSSPLAESPDGFTMEPSLSESAILAQDTHTSTKISELTLIPNQMTPMVPMSNLPTSLSAIPADKNCPTSPRRLKLINPL